MPNGPLSFVLTTINTHLDNLFDFEIKTGDGIKIEVDKGGIKYNVQAGAIYTSIDEHGNVTQGNGEFSGNVSVLDAFTIGVEYNNYDGFTFVYPDQQENSSLKINDKDLKLAFGLTIPNLESGIYGGVEFSFNITKFGRSIFDRKYREELYKSIVKTEKEKFIQKIKNGDYFNKCH